MSSFKAHQNIYKHADTFSLLLCFHEELCGANHLTYIMYIFKFSFLLCFLLDWNVIGENNATHVYRHLSVSGRCSFWSFDVLLNICTDVHTVTGFWIIISNLSHVCWIDCICTSASIWTHVKSDLVNLGSMFEKGWKTFITFSLLLFVLVEFNVQRHTQDSMNDTDNTLFWWSAAVLQTPWRTPWCGWWMGQVPMRVAWRFSMSVGGEQCVMTPGIKRMEMWSVGCWDTRELRRCIRLDASGGVGKDHHTGTIVTISRKQM